MTDAEGPLTAQSEVGRIRRVLLNHPRRAWPSDEAVRAQWRDLRYRSEPDRSAAEAEFDRFASFMEGPDVLVDLLPSPGPGVGLDAIYVRDASVVTDRGVVLCNMGKAARRGEPAAQERHFRERCVPVLGAISGPGRLEGGDVVWLDGRTLAVGLGYRTNEAGIEQLRELAAGQFDELIVVPLPHWRGPDDVFHLMSMLSPVDVDLALVYSPLLPVPFRNALLERGFTLVETPDDDFADRGANVLTLAPREVLMVAGNPGTRRALEAAGVTVHEYPGLEISLKGCGGPTCLTRPLLREAARS